MLIEVEGQRVDVPFASMKLLEVDFAVGGLQQACYCVGDGVAADATAEGWSQIDSAVFADDDDQAAGTVAGEVADGGVVSGTPRCVAEARGRPVEDDSDGVAGSVGGDHHGAVDAGQGAQQVTVQERGGDAVGLRRLMWVDLCNVEVGQADA